MSCSPVSPASPCLYVLVIAGRSAQLVTDGQGRVIAADRAVAGWALRRSVEEVDEFAARFDARCALVDERAALVPA